MIGQPSIPIRCLIIIALLWPVSPCVSIADEQATLRDDSPANVDETCSNAWFQQRSTGILLGWRNGEFDFARDPQPVAESMSSFDDELVSITKQKNRVERDDSNDFLDWQEDRLETGETTPIQQVVGDDVETEELKQLGYNSINNYAYSSNHAATANCAHTWQILPDGLLYRSYLAGEKEPRFGWAWLQERGRDGLISETALGGRVGLIRNGTRGSIKPDGWQLDLEGGALARLDLEQNSDLDAVDFRVGIPWTYRSGPWSAKVGYYHLSSHVGDEFLAKNPGFKRINYVRDSAIVGLSYDPTEDTRVYGEIAYAPAAQGGAEPLEMQLGAEYSETTPIWWHGAPYSAINLHYREEFSGRASVNVVAGWQIVGPESGRRFRVGLQHYNGKSLQYSFFDRNEQLTGGGIWLDY